MFELLSHMSAVHTGALAVHQQHSQKLWNWNDEDRIHQEVIANFSMILKLLILLEC